MSRSNPTETLKNPATKFIDWSGSEGKFKWYNKEAKENVYIDLPFSFIPLDVLTTVKGYNEPENISYWSNEVRNTKTDIITVRSKNGIVMSALYEKIKEKLHPKGAKYHQSVYIAIKDGKEYKLANLQIGGASLKPFIDFAKEHKLTEVAVTVKTFTNEKKGSNKYKAPVFEVMNISEKSNEAAIELDKELQEYLTAYLAKNTSVEAEEKVDENQNNGLNKTTKADIKSDDKPKSFGDDNGSPFDDNDDIPF